MEVKKIVEGMTATQVAQVIDENFNALNGEKATVEAVADVQRNVNRSDDNTGVLSYPEYSNTEPVAVGDVRRYEGLLYRAKEAGAYDWDPEKWERVTLKRLEDEKLSELGSKTKNSISQVHVNAIASQLGGNLFNKNGFGIIKNKIFYDSNTDKIQDRDGYNVSEFIAVEPNVTYLIDGRVKIRGYDVNMKYLDKITAVDNTLTVPENVYWIRFSYYSGWGDVIYLNKGDSKDLKYGLVQSDKIKDGSIGEEKLSEDVKSKLNQQGGVIQPLKTGSYVKRGVLLNEDTWEHPKNSVEVGESITFSANIIGEFGTLYIGHGKTNGAYIKITSNEVVLCSHVVSPMSEKVYQHGLTIENNIQVCIEKEKNTTVSIRITSNGKQSAAFSDGYWYGNKGTPFVENDGCELADCSFGWTCKAINSDIWTFGDSYFGVNGTIRWMAYLVAEGHTNLIVNAFGGQGSISAYEDLTNLFQIGTPKKLLWCLGMNDGDSSTAVNSNWLNTYNSVKSLCESNNIELILATIPTVPSRINKYKNEIVRNSGYRYIDFDNAVGADESTGAWYSDMLSSDGVHPSETGALALYNQAISDMPELLNC